MKTILSIALLAVLLAGQGCSKGGCNQAQLQAQITTYDNEEANELSNPNLTSAQRTAIENKYNNYITTATNNCH